MSFFEPSVIAAEADAVAACVRRHWVKGANTILFTHCGVAALERAVVERLPDLGIEQVYLYDLRDEQGLSANMLALRAVKGVQFVHRANFDRALVVAMKKQRGTLGMVLACNYQMRPAALPEYTRIMRLLDTPVYRHNDTHAPMLVYYNIPWYSRDAAEMLDERCKTIEEWCADLGAKGNVYT
jgi:hypothetical protein